MLLFSGVVFAQTEKTQVEFVATVAAINATDSLSGLLSMQLTPTYAISVRATSRTEIRDENDFPLAFSALKTGMKLKIEGMFTEEGILAREIGVTQGSHEIEVRGTLEAVNLQTRTVTVAGLVIPLAAQLEIRSEDGLWLDLAGLTVGQAVIVEAVMRNEGLEARQIKVATFGFGRARLDFDGTVDFVDDSQMLVKIEGTGGGLVRIHPETEIHGSLSGGAAVRVSGSIGSDLIVDASQIVVKSRLLLNPDELHLDFSQTGRVHVFLTQAPTVDTTLSLVSRNAALASPTTSRLLIPAGKLTGYFDVVSGASEGATLIDVSLPASLGGGSASVAVEVETNGPDDPGAGTPPPTPGTGGGTIPGTLVNEPFEIRFSPDQITGAGNQSLKVQLVLNQPAPTSMTVSFSLAEGTGQPVTFPSQLTIPAGSNFVDVQVTTGSLTGDAKIRAQLPANVGGDTASLKIRIKN
ncbi:MAG: hypothetical protein EHM23_33800 [Acidobacteria bacterium]|nr:MAG: hypothetical protein EHM23_33800 [Acidobacteriota bacterium]